VKELRKALKAFLITVLAYLIQACVMEHLKIADVTGSVIFAVLAIITVSYGKKFIFCASCIIGMIMESMLSNVPALYAIAYPVISMLCAQAFADMNDRQREKRRMNYEERHRRREGRKQLFPLFGKILDFFQQGDLPAHLRIPMCAGLMDLLMNIVLLVYMYLIGVEFSFLHIWRLVVAVAYTVGISILLMIPLRYFMGMYRRRNKRQRGGELM